MNVDERSNPIWIHVSLWACFLGLVIVGVFVVVVPELQESPDTEAEAAQTPGPTPDIQ